MCTFLVGIFYIFRNEEGMYELIDLINVCSTNTYLVNNRNETSYIHSHSKLKYPLYFVEKHPHQTNNKTTSEMKKTEKLTQTKCQLIEYTHSLIIVDEFNSRRQLFGNSSTP